MREERICTKVKRLKSQKVKEASQLFHLLTLQLFHILFRLRSIESRNAVRSYSPAVVAAALAVASSARGRSERSMRAALPRSPRK